MTARFKKTVHMAVGPAAFKALYYDWEHDTLRPDLVFVNPDGSILFEINEIGLKGDALDGRRKLAVVWGDSVVFGYGRSWPCLLDQLAPGYQFLNGGIEGDRYDNILKRALDLNRRYHVVWNILMLGWHPLCHTLPPPDMKAFRGDLIDFLTRQPNTAVLTTPTALNARIAARDLSSFFVDDHVSKRFHFAGHIPYSTSMQSDLFDHIQIRNNIVREVCSVMNILMIDLFDKFDTTDQDDFREWFGDMLHFRAEAYPLVAATVFEGLKHLL